MKADNMIEPRFDGLTTNGGGGSPRAGAGAHHERGHGLATSGAGALYAEAAGRTLKRLACLEVAVGEPAGDFLGVIGDNHVGPGPLDGR